MTQICTDEVMRTDAARKDSCAGLIRVKKSELFVSPLCSPVDNTSVDLWAGKADA